MVEGYQFLIAIDKCFIRTADMKILEYVCETVCASKFMYGMEMWVKGNWCNEEEIL